MSQYRTGSSGRGGHHPRGDRRDGGQSQRVEGRVADLWPDYLHDGYFDAHGHLKIDYVSRERIEPLVEAMCSQQVGLTTHQVRRYFGHCRAIETRCKTSGAEWASFWPEVKKLDVAAADGAAKHPAKIPSLFHDFIKRNVAAIKSQKDFLEGFIPHFEALVGFGQSYFKRDRN